MCIKRESGICVFQIKLRNFVITSDTRLANWAYRKRCHPNAPWWCSLKNDMMSKWLSRLDVRAEWLGVTLIHIHVTPWILVIWLTYQSELLRACWLWDHCGWSVSESMGLKRLKWIAVIWEWPMYNRPMANESVWSLHKMLVKLVKLSGSVGHPCF